MFWIQQRLSGEKKKNVKTAGFVGGVAKRSTLPKKGTLDFRIFPFSFSFPQIFDNEKNKAKTGEGTQGAGFCGPLWRRRDPPVLYHQYDAKGKDQVLIRFLYCTVCDFSPIKSAFTPGEAFWYQ
jgi:hypothetical protein